MNILHCCFACFYNEGYNYQENLLPIQNKKDGHKVWIVASTEIFKDNKTAGYTEPEEYVNKYGIDVIRVSYRKIINNVISHKFRAYKGVYAILERINPDVILFHGMAAWELRTVARYAKKNSVKLFVDNHASLINSAHGWFAKKILHGIFYRQSLQKAMPIVEKVLCIGTSEYDFAKTVYKVSENKLELWPLGGNIQDEEEYNQIRVSCRKELQITDDKIVFVHSGRMQRKKKTITLLKAFNGVQDERFLLLIVGEFWEDVEEIKKLIRQDSRVCYLGWKSGSELLDILTAADVYVQPGSMSATMQNAMCCRCAMVVQPTEFYQYLLQETGIYIQTKEELEQVLLNVSKGNINIEEVKKLHFERAQKLLDYKNIAKRLYE